MNVLVFCISMLWMSANAVAAPAFILFQENLDPLSMAEILRIRNCRLPSIDQLRWWYANASGRQAVPTPPAGLYWVLPPPGTVGFAQYVHLPSQEARDFGGHVFPAQLLAIC